jgi:hypothetical protein
LLGGIGGFLSGVSGYFGDIPHFFAGQPKSHSKGGNGNGSEGRPDFRLDITQQFYARDYDAFTRGAIILFGAIVIILMVAIRATWGNKQ